MCIGYTKQAKKSSKSTSEVMNQPTKTLDIPGITSCFER
jgi:hypothetical protein